MWGRGVYDNIRKFLQFQLTVNGERMVPLCRRQQVNGKSTRIAWVLHFAYMELSCHFLVLWRPIQKDRQWSLTLSG